jgi:hypothetical protein
VSSSSAPVAITRVVRDTLRFLRRHFWYLTTLSAIVWLPLAALEITGVAHGIEIDTDRFRPGDILLNVVIVLVFELLAAELLSAASEKIVASDLREVARPTRREFLRTVPWGALVLGTLVYEVGVMIGLVFFIVPGFVLAVWGVVTGPVIVAERCRALRAPGRSRELVRGSFRPAAVLVLAGFALAELFSAAANGLLGGLPHDWAEPIGEYVVQVLTTPLFGMGTAVLYYALLARERARTSPPERAR